MYWDSYAKKNNAHYYFISPPNKHAVYAEYMPDNIRRLSNVSKLDQILGVMKGSGVAVIDLRPALLAAKQERQIYHKGDTHWNMIGANIAQYAILSRIREDLPELDEPVLHADAAFELERWPAFSAAGINYYNGNSGMMGFGYEADEPQPLLKTHNWDCVAPAVINYGAWDYLDPSIKANVFEVKSCNQKRYRLLMFRDSFSELLTPFLSKSFSLSVYIRPPRPLSMDWQQMIDLSKPDVIIDETLERYLKMVPRRGIDYPADFNADSASATLE